MWNRKTCHTFNISKHYTLFRATSCTILLQPLKTNSIWWNVYSLTFDLHAVRCDQMGNNLNIAYVWDNFYLKLTKIQAYFFCFCAFYRRVDLTLSKFRNSMLNVGGIFLLSNYCFSITSPFIYYMQLSACICVIKSISIFSSSVY